MKKIKTCSCGGSAKLRKISEVSYCVVCSSCGNAGRSVYLDEEHTLCETQNIAIEAWNDETEEK
jgi:hypothetical protein